MLVREDGTPALIDFGISKRIVVAHYEEQQVFSLGSPYYMSPEQVCGEPLDVRSDIYSFGALWFRIFTGKVPFEGRSFDELRLARERPIPSMGYVLRHYQSIVDKTLAPNPDDRFSTAQELVHEIERYANSATGVHHCLDLQDILEAPCFQGASN